MLMTISLMVFVGHKRIHLKEQTSVDLSEGDQGITVGRAALGPVTGRKDGAASLVNIWEFQQWNSGKMVIWVVKFDEHMGIWAVKLGSTGVKLDQDVPFTDRFGLFRAGKSLIWVLEHSEWSGKDLDFRSRIWDWSTTIYPLHNLGVEHRSTENPRKSDGWFTSFTSSWWRTQLFRTWVCLNLGQP